MLTLIFVIVLIVILFLIYKFVNFLTTHGKFIPSSLVILFVDKVKKIQDGEDGKVIVKTLGDFKVIVIMKDNNIVDSISVDIKNSKVYSGIVDSNSPNWSDVLIPVSLPYNSDSKTVDEIRLIEDSLVDEIMQILVSHESDEK